MLGTLVWVDHSEDIGRITSLVLIGTPSAYELWAHMCWEDGARSRQSYQYTQALDIDVLNAHGLPADNAWRMLVYMRDNTIRDTNTRWGRIRADEHYPYMSISGLIMPGVSYPGATRRTHAQVQTYSYSITGLFVQGVLNIVKVNGRPVCLPNPTPRAPRYIRFLHRYLTSYAQIYTRDRCAPMQDTEEYIPNTNRAAFFKIY